MDRASSESRLLFGYKVLIFFAVIVFIAVFTFSFTLPVRAVQNYDGNFGAERTTLNGQFRVEPNQFDGSFSYEYPLAEPPGRNGIQPNFSLMYSSGNKEQISPFGYGWSMSIPYVERINRKGLNRMYDFGTEVFYSTLDGELAATSTSQGNIGYGALVDNGDFRQYIYEGENHWRIVDKNGTTYTFGTSTTSQIVSTASSTQIYRWMLEEVRDRNDNYITYTYTKDNDQIYPKTITYTSNGSERGIYEYTFTLASRNDIATSSVAGFPVVSKYRVSEIQIKVNGAWERKYELAYTTGTNGTRSLLSSITETGKDENGNTTTLPATSFVYTTATNLWSQDTAWHIPVYFVDETGDADVPKGDMGVRFDDFDGDGKVDIIQHRTTGGGDTKALYSNNGNGSWATTTPSGMDRPFVNVRGEDLNTRPVDVDGDGLADIMQGATATAINGGRGSSFSASGYTPTINFTDTTDSRYHEIATRVVDVNGDGLPDLLKAYNGSQYSSANGIYLNNGSGWDATSTYAWTIPDDARFSGTYDSQNGIDFGVRFGDFNGDGLVDILRSRTGQTPTHIIYLNDGDGTWSDITPTGVPDAVVTAGGGDNAIRLADINGDGLMDIVETDSSTPLAINQNGGVSFTDAGSALPVDFVCEGSPCAIGEDVGGRFIDIDADGLVDIVKSNDLANPGGGSNGVYIHAGNVPDMLKTITTDAGGTITVGYKPSTQYLSGTSTTNKLAPVVFQTAETVTMSDGFGMVGTTTYAYEGADYYYIDEFDRKFAGFATTTVTDALGHVTKTYVHQGNASQSAIGEYSDSKAKIGKLYRTEVYDNASNLYTKAITKWESAPLSNSRDFVKKTRAVEFAYDGDSDHRDKGVEFLYDNTFGNLATTTDYGEVSGSDDGTFSDVGLDTRFTAWEYAENTAKYIVGLPKTEIVSIASTTVSGGGDTNTYSIDFEKNSEQYAKITDGSQTGLDGSNSAMTFAAWVKFESTPANSNIVNKYDSPNSQMNYFWFISSDTTVAFYVTADNGSTEKDSRIDVSSLGTGWHHFAVVFEGSTKIEHYVDGVSVGTDTTSIPAHVGNQSGDFLVGARKHGGSIIQEVDGLVDDVRVWSRTLSDAEIESLYGDPVNFSNGSSLQGYWKFNNSYSDASGNSNTLTAVSSPVFSTTVPFTGGTTATTTSRVAERRFYYDTQALGTVTTGNLTKEEGLVSTTTLGTYIDTERTYNAYGLVATEKDARDKTTTYTYESANLFVGTTTNPVGHVTETYRDMSSGKVKKLVDPNGLAFETTLDGLDRATAEKVPDHLGTPSSLVNKTEYTYTDTAGSKSVLQTNHLSSATSTLIYTYADGFSRSIQTRVEAEIGGDYAVSDTQYNGRGEMGTTSLPYFSSGSSRTSATSDADLLITSTYDSLGRIKTVVNNQGTETDLYDQWRETVRDRENNIKDQTSDAFGNLVQVDENDGSATSTTSYTYDPLNNLTKITDAAGNIRNFTYNALSRLTKSEDLHTTADTTFASTTYIYDDTGNVSSKLDAKNQAVSYTYDDINRVLTENYTGASGTEVTYIYDTCGYGKGRMCGATTTDATTNLGYDALGNKISEIRRIDNATSTTQFEWDRQGNMASSTYPNGSQVRYGYNAAGQLEALFIKPAGSSTLSTIIEDFDYAPTGQVSFRKYGNGLETAYTYDADELYRLRNILTAASTVSTTEALGTYSLDLESSSSQYASITDASQTGLDITTLGTIAAWVRLESQPATNSTYSIVAKYNASPNYSYRLRYTDTSGVLTLRFSQSDNGDGVGERFVTQTLSNDTWYHIAVTFSGSGGDNRVRFYVNGVQVGSDQTAFNQNIYNGTSPFTIGAGEALGEHLDGLIDDVRVWTRELTSSEISSLYTNPVTFSNGANLQGYWQLENNYSDSSGNSNTLTAVNSPVFSLTVPTYGSTTTASTMLQSITYAYDNVGNITNITDHSDTGAAKTINYLYDDLYRLVNASTTAASSTPYIHTLTYSNLGNITAFATGTAATSTYTYAGTDYANPHAATSIGGVTQTYDNNGNLITVGGTTYTWDYRDRLTRIASSSPSTTYGYDHDNMRVWKAFNNATTTYPNMAYSTSTTGTSTVSVMTPDGTLVGTIEQNSTSTPIFYYIHPDHLGGTNVVTNSASTTVEVSDFYPFGAQRIHTKAGNYSQREQFTGHEFDLSSDLTYAKARYYDHDLGKFLSKDPILEKNLEEDILRDPQQLNFYAYSRNNPITVIDPTGQQATISGSGALPGVIGALITILSIISSSPQVQEAISSLINSLQNVFQSHSQNVLINAPSSSNTGTNIQPTTQLNAAPGTQQRSINISESKAGPLPTPDQLKGKSPDEIDQIMQEKGISGEPGRGEGVIRYPVPGRPGDQVLIEPGRPGDPNPVKRGPYGRVSENGKRSDPFPLEGNPTLNK